MVLIINQYLAQMYMIPSGSMIDTLNIGDRVFVNKIIYGPELLPGVLKLPSPVKPKRNDVIIFENPSYISRGPVFDIAQRLIYMLTLSFIDIDRDENGEPRVHFLIKRAVGKAGDRFVMERGNMKILFAGEEAWVSETDYNASRLWKHNVSRIMKDQEYESLAAAGKASALIDLGLPVGDKLYNTALPAGNIEAPDYIAHEKARLEMLRKITPADRRYAMLLAKYNLGWYISEGRVFPMGDNRDNSRDGRFFGPVRISKVLGRGTIIYWPLHRAGRIL
uniref:Signal peptidase I n=1 Tax=uncultured bacterium contig00030 TaxID=1181519 RepID=A0A806K0T4_9BACT|nr:signal peptidase I [uncultured bacterium contig00030]